MANVLFGESRLKISDIELSAWLIEGAVRYIGKPISVPILQSLPVLYPFTLMQAPGLRSFHIASIWNSAPTVQVINLSLCAQSCEYPLRAGLAIEE